MDKNKAIKAILEKRLSKYEMFYAKNDVLKCLKKHCRDSSITIKELRAMDAFDLSDDEECVLKVLDNEKLQKEIQTAISNIRVVNNEENQTYLHRELRDVFEQAIEEQKVTNVAAQIIFLEHDHEAFFSVSGFGEGDYPLLKTPQYVKYDSTNIAFGGINKVDYSPICQPIKMPWAEECLGRCIEFFDNIPRMNILKTYIILHEVFQSFAKDSVFKQLKKEKPLFIYANEHDCEASSIFIFE